MTPTDPPPPPRLLTAGPGAGPTAGPTAGSGAGPGADGGAADVRRVLDLLARQRPLDEVLAEIVRSAARAAGGGAALDVTLPGPDDDRLVVHAGWPEHLVVAVAAGSAQAAAAAAGTGAAGPTGDDGTPVAIRGATIGRLLTVGPSGAPAPASAAVRSLAVVAALAVDTSARRHVARHRAHWLDAVVDIARALVEDDEGDSAVEAVCEHARATSARTCAG